MKKLFALLLAVSMCLVTSPIVFASPVEVTLDDHISAAFAEELNRFCFSKHLCLALFFGK